MRTPRCVSPERCGAGHQIACQPVHAVHHHGITLADEGEQPFQFGTLRVLAGSLIGEDLTDIDSIQLPIGFWSKLLTDVADALTLQDASQGTKVSG